MQETRTNFDVLIRILDAPTSFAATDDDDVSSVLTEDERVRLREVITHDVQIKKFLQVKKIDVALLKKSTLEG